MKSSVPRSVDTSPPPPACTDGALGASPLHPDSSKAGLQGKRVGMVLFSTYPYDPRPRRAVDALISEGMAIELICLADDGAPKHESRDRFDVRRISITHERGGKFSYAYRYSAFILVSAAILAWRSLWRRYDLVYVHNMPDVLVVSALIPKALGAKVILDQHDPMPELATTIFGVKENSLAVRLIRMLEKWSLARAHLVITVNTACKRIFGSRSCSPEKIGVVMNAPDGQIFPFRAATSYRSTKKLPAEPFVIMYHGSLVERNGLELAVDALAKVRATVPSAELRIYGRETPFLWRVMESARSQGLEKNVHYLGAKRLEDLVPAIEACDVGVIPNHRNAFTEINTPTRIFEYLALGKPVIAPSTRGIMDYFTEESLFLFEPGNSSEIAHQIEYVARNSGEATRIAECGQQIYLQHTWKQERGSLVDLVRGLLSGRRALNDKFANG
jgi:glycosyltransferase involved in cell wall biosynthesis